MRKVWPGIVPAVFFLILVGTLGDYGIHEDAPFHFLRGQYFLERILGREGVYALPATRSPVLFLPRQRVSTYKLNASEELFAPLVPIEGAGSEKSVQQEYREMTEGLGKRSSFYKHNTWTANIWDLTDNQGHPAISDMLMAATNRVFYEGFGWLPDIEAYHLYGVFVVSLSLFFLYVFVADAFGPFAAVISVVTLALYPMVFGETHFNIKDPIQMGFYTMAVVSGYFTITRKLSLDWLVLFVGSIFLALGTKWNIVFLPLILVPWIFVFRKKTDVGQATSWHRLLLYGALAVIIPIILLLLLYPFYWTHTVLKLINTLEFYTSLGVKDLRIQQPSFAPLPWGFDGRAILQFFSMSPPLMVLIGAIGAIGLMRGKITGKHNAGILILLWFVVPLLRVIWQISEFYGSMRHFMEFLPAFAVLVGIGAAWIVRKRTFQVGFIVAFILIHAITLVQWHPYEHIYFNRFVGGLSGAQNRGLYAWETLFDAPYRQMAAWLSKNAEKDARLAHLDGTMIALSPSWLRDDIRIGSYFSGLDGKGEYIASMIYPKPPAVFPINYLEAFVKPVYEVVVDGVVVAKIWKNDKEHTTISQKSSIGKNDLVVRPARDGQTDIVLPKAYRILSATVDVSDIRCLTVRSLVWGVLQDDKVSYTVPWISRISDTRVLVSFPGIPGKGIQWWDREKAGCKDVQIERIEGIE